MLLTDVETLIGEHLTDHIWMNWTKGFGALDPWYPGDVVAFDARVGPYVKGYAGRGEDNRVIDYRLTRPTKIERLVSAPHEDGYYSVCDCGFHHVGGYITCRRCGMLPPGTAPPEKPPQQVAEEEFEKFKQTVLGESRS